jgi:hypothetical protein
MERFQYKKEFYKTPFYSAFLVLLGVGIGIFAMRREVMVGLILIAGWCSFFIPILTIANLGLSDVIVDNYGISWSFYGKTWKTIRWTDMRRIRLMMNRSYELHRMVVLYHIVPDNRNISLFSRRLPMFFDETIQNRGRLLELLNRYIHQYNIEIIDARSKPEIRIDRL